MAFSVPNGLPGMLPTYLAQPRDIFYSNAQFAQYLAGPLVVDGTLSSNALNTPYTWDLWAGMLFGKVTTTGKYRNSIIGLSTAAYTSGTTSLTVAAATAAEVNRLIGLAGGFHHAQHRRPPSGGGTNAVISTTCSAASGTTLTITNLAANVVSGGSGLPRRWQPGHYHDQCRY